jgi:radical SAM superfamily enzyme YgiQ (UPF0313 family)
MLDLLIVNPPSTTAYGDLDQNLVACEPPMWARLIAGYIRDRGFEVKILDAEAEGFSPSEVAACILAARARLVCIAAYGHQPSASTQQMPGAGAISKAIKRLAVESPIIMVGGHVSALPQRTMQEESIDYACVGEGPVTILGLLTGQDQDDIPGLVWRDGDNVYLNPSAPLIDMKHLHGNAWDLLPMNKYRSHNWQVLDGSSRQPYASIHTTLNCPFKCLAGDTPVNTIYGNIPIRELVKRFGDKGVPIYTFDPESKRAYITDSIHIRKYGKSKLVRVRFDDGTHIDCTPDHKFLQFKWGQTKAKGKQWACEAQNLVEGAHVRALRFEYNSYVERIYVNWSGRGRQVRSRMIMEYLIKRRLKKTEHVHHVDHDSTNDHPNNLEYYASALEHFSQHPEIGERMRTNNPAKNMTPEWRAKITKGLTGLTRSAKSIENYRKAAQKRAADPAYIAKLRIAAKKREEVRRRWWTDHETGRAYRSVEAKHAKDFAGRRNFNPWKNKQEDGKLINHRVVSVTPLKGVHDVYCLTVPATGWFYANNVLVKNCSFCCISAPFGNNVYRMRDSTEVVNEMVMLNARYGVKTFKIVDEMFVLNERHYTAIAKQLIATGLGKEINVWAYARIDTVKPHTLEMLRQAGFRWLALGIESGSKHVRDGAQKALKNDDIVDVVRNIQRAGINVIGNYIFGLPDDDYPSMQATLRLAMELNTEYANFYSAMAYPGSKLYEEAVKTGIELPKNWSGYAQHSEDCLPLSTQSLTAKQVLAFRDMAFQVYFTSPVYLGMIRHRYGAAAEEQIKQMTNIRLKRNLLEEPVAA